MQDQNALSDVAPVWIPKPDRVAAAPLKKFQALAEKVAGKSLADYAALHRWSIDNPEQFWAMLAGFCGVIFAEPGSQILVNKHSMPGAQWFVDAQLNFAENLLRYRDDHPALIFRDERGRRTELSYRQLYAQVARAAAGLRRAGVVAGDRVVGVVPNCPEAVIAMLAATSLGAVWSSCSPDFGASAVLDRFGQIEPRILFVPDGYSYGGKRIDCLPLIGELASQLASLEQIIVIPFADDAVSIPGIACAAMSWVEFLLPADDISFVPMAFADPVYIMYSSGTTGVPKCIVHGGGGTLLQHLKEHRLHTGISRDDRFFFFTTCGWMMWNWLVSGLASGATIVLYDGSPFEPDSAALWQVIAEERVSVFGAGAKYFHALEQAAFIPADHCDLSALHTVQSTGSPLSPASFDFIYQSVKPDVAVQSISGGTDLLGCFALGNPMGPVYRGELQCIGLGMDVAVYSQAGKALPAGHKGELVCRRPFPSMPVGFWGDDDGSLYQRAYFERFSQVWTHGDYAELTDHGGLIIHGRSDATLNPGGVRIGTAEIYRPVEQLAAIRECVAVGQLWSGDTRIVLFVVLNQDAVLDEALAEEIRSVVRQQASPRHVPATIVQVGDIPRTRSGKLAELAVRAVINGEEPDNLAALANPASLAEFREFFAQSQRHRPTDEC